MYDGTRAGVRLCVCSHIKTTGEPITIKFYLKRHCGGKKAALGFGPDWIRTLVSMEIDSYHQVIMLRSL